MATLPTFYQLYDQESDLDFKNKLRLVLDVAEKVKERSGRVYVVGGFVRDSLFNAMGHSLQPTDIDLEIYGIGFSTLKSLLLEFGEVNPVGESFGVLMLKDLEIAIPRKDSKIGAGHKNFEVISDPDMPIQEAVQRRDFTINALLLNPLTGEVMDEVGGMRDLQSKTLRAVNEQYFGDDPLRVLRAMQFAARFGFSLDEKTEAICKSISDSGELGSLSKDRVREEWYKLLLKSQKPSIGLRVALKIGIVDALHPELKALVGTEQEPEWHPEGDVWTHTLEVVDNAAAIVRREQLAGQQALVVMLGALCHDLGKPLTTRQKEVRGKMRITSYGHDKEGVGPAKSFLRSIGIPRHIMEKVFPLVAEHLIVGHYSKDKFGDAAVRRLIVRLYPATLKELIMVAEADHPNNFQRGREIMDRALGLEAEGVASGKIKPIIQGRHLMEMGFVPGPELGKILKDVFRRQLEGEIASVEDGVEYVKKKWGEGGDDNNR